MTPLDERQWAIEACRGDAKRAAHDLDNRILVLLNDLSQGSSIEVPPIDALAFVRDAGSAFGRLCIALGELHQLGRNS